MSDISTQRKFEISKWINDQFETGEPPEIPHPPRDLDDDASWQSDPDSGITGTVYLAPETVYYSIPAPTPSQTGWWNMGQLPERLREEAS